MNTRDQVLTAFNDWWSQRKQDKRGGLPPRGNIAAALVVLHRLKSNFDLKFESHQTERGGQIAGMGAGALKAILSEHGERREFLKEGGRTNRGNHETVETLLGALASTDILNVSDDQRVQLINELQILLVEMGVREHLDRERIKFEYIQNKPIYSIIANILSVAKTRGQDGYVAQHLVGAKLAVRFRTNPDIEVPNFQGSASDDQSGRAGDFEIGDTAFHITVSPTETTMRRCQQNLANGLASTLIVPNTKLVLARGLAEQADLLDKISVEALESFVGQNISELGVFARDGLKRELALLLNVYNERVNEVESDKSLMIEVPRSLQ